MSTQDCTSAGFALPSDYQITENERAWVSFLRLVAGDTDPRPTLHLVQALQRAVREAER